MTKGYVVRGVHKGASVFSIGGGGDFAEQSEDGFDHPWPFDTLGGASAAVGDMDRSGCTDVTIFAVTEEGETPLLSYEEALARVDVLQKRERRMFDGFRAEIDRIQDALGIGPTRSVLWCVAEIGRLRARPHFVPVCRDCGAAVERGQCCEAKGCPPYPLAALRAAEERLLDSHGWKPGDPGFWIDPDDGTQWPREGAIATVRRRPEPCPTALYPNEYKKARSAAVGALPFAQVGQ